MIDFDKIAEATARIFWTLQNAIGLSEEESAQKQIDSIKQALQQVADDAARLMREEAIFEAGFNFDNKKLADEIRAIELPSDKATKRKERAMNIEDIDHYVIEVLREYDFNAPQSVLDELARLYDGT